MIFVDTNAFISLVIENDAFHQTASAWWQKHKGAPLCTSNLIVIETLGWIRYKAGKAIAIEVGNRLLGSDTIRVEKVTSQDEEEAWKLFQKTDGRGVSMIDCTSFTLMKRLGLSEIFTFDTDFADQGYIQYPTI